MWPEKAIIHNTTTLPELKETAVPERKESTIVMTLSTDRNNEFSLLTKFSNYQQMLNVTAYVQRFIKNCRSNYIPKRPKSLVCKEILSTDEL